MYQELLDKNSHFIKNYPRFRKHNSQVQLGVDLLNTHRVFTLFGIKHSEKTGLIHSLLKQTQMFPQTFYFNADLDSLKSVKNEKDCIILFDIYVRIHGLPKVVVLENCNSIDNIQHFITQLIQTKKYKIILVGNNIKISGVPSIEYFPTSNPKEHIFGGLPKVAITPHAGYKRELINSLRNDILLKEIVIPYNIKNIELLIRVITYISMNHGPYSSRELHRNLQDHGVDISLITLMDYLSALLNTSFLHQIQSYDLKREKSISSQNFYYFGDVGIGQSYEQDTHFTMKNALYLSLRRKGYQVSAGVNGAFHFDFYARKESDGYCLHMSTSDSANELRKIARRLAKIENDFEKYLIVPSTEKLAMRKFEEQGVLITGYDEMYKILNN